jgi:Ca2+-binding EF-hand superfamily protein
MFNAFDTDHDGRIDAGELGGALAHYKYGSPITPSFFR